MNRHNSPYRWVILALAIFAYTVVIFHRMSPAVMADAIMADLGVNAAFLGLLASAYFYPYAVLQIPSGIMSDTYSPRKLISFALALTCIGTFIFATASHGTMAFLGRLGVGIGCSLILMPAYKALADWFSQKVYVIIVSSVLAVAVGVASALAGAPLSHFVESFGWRLSTQGLTAITLVATVLTWFFFKDGTAKPAAMESVGISEVVAEPKLSVLASIKIILGKRNFWLLTLAFTVNAAILFSFVGLWAGLYYTHVVGLSRQEMSSLLSIAAMIAIVAPILFATVAAKLSSRKGIIVAANAVFFAMMLYFFLKNGSFGSTEIFIWGIGLSIVLNSPAGLYMASARELFPKNIASTANGLLYSFAMFGSAVFQPLIGALLDNAGYTDALTAAMFTPVCWLYVLSTGAAFVALLFLQEKHGKLL